MNKREERVIRAFVNCVRRGEYSEDYAITLIEDDQRYGWISAAAKEAFYAALEPEPEEIQAIAEVEPEEIQATAEVEPEDGDDGTGD